MNLYHLEKNTVKKSWRSHRSLFFFDSNLPQFKRLIFKASWKLQLLNYNNTSYSQEKNSSSFPSLFSTLATEQQWVSRQWPGQLAGRSRGPHSFFLLPSPQNWSHVVPQRLCKRGTQGMCRKKESMEMFLPCMALWQKLLSCRITSRTSW